MKRYIVASCLLVLLCGCNKQYEYSQGVDHAASQLGQGIVANNRSIPANIVFSTNGPIVLPKDAIGLATSPLTNSHTIYMPYPYTLHDRKKIEHGYEWQVVQDASGILRNAGQLRLYGKDNILIVDAPNDVVENFVIENLRLKSPTKP